MPKTSKQKNDDFSKRKRLAGYVQMSAWVKKEHVPKVREFVAGLDKKT